MAYNSADDTISQFASAQDISSQTQLQKLQASEHSPEKERHLTNDEDQNSRTPRQKIIHAFAIAAISIGLFLGFYKLNQHIKAKKTNISNIKPEDKKKNKGSDDVDAVLPALVGAAAGIAG